MSIPAQETAPAPSTLLAALTWRNIGPHRASRTVAAAGHRSHPFTFYMAQVNGGVWKTTDAGRTWKPIFDDQDTGSIGSIVVAPSDANVVYVGSGEGLHRPDLSTGDGVYKSTDAGATWTHLEALRDAQQIPSLAVDPRNANRLFVAALGHPYGPNEERGIFRSTDGGRTFEKVLYKDENTGGNDVDIDPSNPDIVYATMWEERQGPWENSGLGGHRWRHLQIDRRRHDLEAADQRPAAGRAGQPGDLTRQPETDLCVGRRRPRRQGCSTARAAGRASTAATMRESRGSALRRRAADRTDRRRRPADAAAAPEESGHGDLASTVSWKSTDGGMTWAPFKGAPGGEDYQNGWINPDNPDIMLFAVDQGAVVTLNGGRTWSSWYNQSTAQIYHVSADNAFPYRVCSGQQESGSACVSSRGSYGAISIRDWTPVGVDEYGLRRS